MTMPDPTAAATVPDGGGFAANLSITLGRILDTQDKLCAQLDAAALARANLPVLMPIQQQGVVVVGTPLVIDLGGPQQGRQWTIRALAVSDAASVRNPVAGTTFGDWFIGKPPPTAGQPAAVQQWQWSQSSLPRIDVFSNEQIPITPQDHLFCVVTGATTAGQQLLAAATILDAPQASFMATMNI